jgi:hypothetical protein
MENTIANIRILDIVSTRRKIACITLLHKAIHEKVAIPIPSYIIKPTRTSRLQNY